MTDGHEHHRVIHNLYFNFLYVNQSILITLLPVCYCFLFTVMKTTESNVHSPLTVLIITMDYCYDKQNNHFQVVTHTKSGLKG